MKSFEQFVPRYPAGVRIGVIGLPILFVALIFAGLALGTMLPVYAWWGVIVVGLVAAILPYFFIQRIDFRELMVVRRYLLPPVYFDVQEMGTVEKGMLVTRRGTLRVGRLLNQDELEERLQRWKADHALRAAAGTRKWPIGTILIRSGYGTYGFAWAMLIGLVALLVLPTGSIDPRWIFGGVFLGMYLLLAWVLPSVL